MKVRIIRQAEDTWYKVGDVIEVENTVTETGGNFYFMVRGEVLSGVLITDCEIIEDEPKVGGRWIPPQPDSVTVQAAIEAIQKHMQESYSNEVAITIFPDDDSVISYGDCSFLVPSSIAENTLSCIYALSALEFQDPKED